MDRRSLLRTAVAALGGSIAAGIATLGGRFALATSRWPVRSARGWAALCKKSDLSAGAPFAASFSFRRLEGWYVETVTRQVYVTLDERGAPLVFSRRCTHLGCQIAWKPQSGAFRCPCHGGVFDPGGRVTDGPPPRGLDVLRSRVAGEVVEVEQA
jgi:nitrite reductase/ring-hydroxylating ferredoxin subunit